ncbi:MAG: RBBP9/YdeN family alpha/beta hydrolase [Candidatus Micrarchaeia archaeon]
MKFFIIHGAGGYPEENWFPWLKAELEKQGHEVVVPWFPTPENQALENWMNVMEPYIRTFNSDTVLVAHSLGPAFAVSLLERINVKIRACFFVAGFTGNLGIEEFDSINTTFMEKEFNWEKARRICSEFFVYGSDNDPYVPLEMEEDFAINLGTKMTVVNGAGHFNKKAGYAEFPRLLEDIQKL